MVCAGAAWPQFSLLAFESYPAGANALEVPASAEGAAWTSPEVEEDEGDGKEEGRLGKEELEWKEEERERRGKWRKRREEERRAVHTQLTYDRVGRSDCT